MPMLAAENGALNYFKLTFSQKVYVQITCYKRLSISSKNFLDAGITFARKFQYLPCNFQLHFVTKYLIVTYLEVIHIPNRGLILELVK